MKIKRNEAPVVEFVPATRLQPALFIVQCPYGCIETTPTGRPKKNGKPKTHVHGAGALGADHQGYLGHRQSHCVHALGRGYELTDPSGLVPARSTEVAS